MFRLGANLLQVLTLVSAGQGRQMTFDVVRYSMVLYVKSLLYIYIECGYKYTFPKYKYSMHDTT